MKALLFILLFPLLTFAREVKVLVIDTGIDGNNIEMKKYFTGGDYEDWVDRMGHGTHVAGIIASSNCPNLKITSCKFLDLHSPFYINADKRTIECYQKAIAEHYDVINYSAGTKEYFQEELLTLRQIEEMGETTVVVAAGNDDKYLGSPCGSYFPACFNLSNMRVVGNLAKDGSRGPLSNYGMPGMVWEYGTNIFSTLPGNQYGRMSGTSMAAANHTKRLVQDLCYR